MSRMHVVRLMMRPELKAKKIGPEDRMAIEFATQLRVWSIEGKLKAVWTHVPNEIGMQQSGMLSKLRYAIAKAMGMIAGTSDYVFMWGGGSAALEAKRPGGKQRPGQEDFEAWCRDNGVPYHIFETAEQGFQILRDLGILQGA